ncbi:hypothetical protein F4604DRAFT_1687540 [Suillus subluteus]|nr:hypothetical protein F4604DRAFT_1687540 [Suillus subluteus]
MTGNDSESDEEAPKHLPLNEEEVAVLEGYLKQWKSTLGAERNVVWEDATKEAQVKVPAMKAESLRSQKNNHGGKKEVKPPINLGWKWTYQSVVESLRKRELLKKIEAETGAKPGEPEMMNHYAKYLTNMVNSLTEEIEEATEMAVEWNKQDVPPELQADIARRKGEDIPWENSWCQGDQYQGVIRECRVSTMDSHDYNEEFGNGESFIKTCDWEVILPEWDGYVAKQFNDDATIILEDCSGRTKDPVPCKEVIPQKEELIPPPYLLEGRKIWEPSRMNRNEATKLLDFWYNRQQTCRDITFEFYSWWSKADKEVKPPVGKMSLFEDDKPVDDQRGKNLGGKGKTQKRTGQNPTAMVDDTSDSSDEDGVLTHGQKPPKKTAKKHWNSKSQASSEDHKEG